MMWNGKNNNKKIVELPGSIKNNHTVGSYQIDAKTSGLGRDQEQSHVRVFLVVEVAGK